MAQNKGNRNWRPPPFGTMSLPERIQCGSCKAKKSHMRYSNNSLKKYQAALGSIKARRGDAGKVELPFCRDCMGESRVDMDCISCDKTYALDFFSKAQRNKAEPRCKDCMQEREDQVPDLQDALEEQQIFDEIESHGGGVSGWSARGRSSALPSTNGARSYNGRPSRSGPTSAMTDSDQVWIPEESSPTVQSRWNTRNPVGGSRIGQAQSQTGTNSDEDDTNTVNGRAPSMTSQGTNSTWAAAGWQPIEQTYRHRQTSQVTGASRNPGFATQGAVRETAEERAKTRARREEARKQQHREEEEEDDDDQSSSDSEHEL